MDILGLKYFTKSAFKFLRGTARESAIVTNSFKIIKSNVQNANGSIKNGTVKDYKEAHRTAFYTIFIFAATFLAMLAGVFWCLHINLTWSALACFSFAVVFGMLSVRSIRDYEEMKYQLALKKE